jgi:homoserine dehydrogenase
MIQKEPAEGSNIVSIIMLTHKVLEKQMNEAIALIEKLDAISGSVTRIRMETLG